ncbi:uncharacterized protein A4U43_C07F33090 [Asparagus officinalis]|uniref:KIB1-4 beta-propeller domain-containing protein n=1 Tax=Asparagus officinalis TaxID=4686 RepID=A0A5P1ELY4_ASPOF|nr:uncharacterized protein A4U43_C07F33090 [Asparagus officinalis]
MRRRPPPHDREPRLRVPTRGSVIVTFDPGPNRLTPFFNLLSADPSTPNLSSITRQIASRTARWPSPPFGYNLGYTRLGIDRAWIELKDTLTRDRFQDVVAYKDGLFCALDFYARKVVALDFSSPPTVRLTDLTLNLPAYRDRNDGWTCFQEAQLVNSSSKLFLVRWRSLVKVGETKRREVDVYKLMDVSGDDADKKWVPIRSLGNSSFFLGLNRSISLSTATFPKLRTNCIYIPWDAIYRMPPENDMYSATSEEEDDEDHRTYLIYDLGDQGWDEYYSSSDELFYDLWMTPRLPSKSTC